jgi:hypothetical protein
MASGTAASVKLCATGLQRPRVLTLKIELRSACVQVFGRRHDEAIHGSQARWLARIGQEGKSYSIRQRITDIAGTLSATARNGRLRERRREIWRRAEAATQYWRVRLDFHDAVEIAQHREVPEARYHPIVNSEDRYPMVRRYREALMKQPLTPAPDANSVKWKQWALAGANIVSPT